MFPCERVEVWAQDYLIALVWTTNQDFFSQLLTAVKEDIKSLHNLLFVVMVFTEDLLSFKTTIIKMHAI